MNIIIVSGSIRDNASTRKVALSLESHLLQHHRIQAEVVNLADYDYPIWKEVFEKEADPPERCVSLYAKLQSANALIFVTPEYNGSYSLALKNMVDYFGLKVFRRKIIGVTAVSTGAMGGIRAGLQLQQLILAIFAIPVPQMLLVPNIHHHFGKDGMVLDASFEMKVVSFTDEFIWLAEAIEEKQKQMIDASLNSNS